LGLLERDPDETAATLTRWLTEVAGVAAPEVTDVSIPGSTGWSNETLFFDATLDGGEPRRLVARIAPSGYQVFPDDTFLTQHAVMLALAERTAVPMAAIHRLETDPAWFGQPFWIMDRIDGDIPADVPPYSGEGWIHDMPPDGQAAVWKAGIDAMAAVHRVDLASLDLPVGTLATSDDSVGLHLDHYERFLTWAEDGTRFDLARGALDDLRRTAPPEPAEGQALAWGDSRLSNLIYRDGRVVAVLDWEMCGVGDPLQDLGYWLFADWALSLGSGYQRVGGFPSWEDTAAHWSEATGRSVAALDWYIRFGGLKFTVIMLRMGRLLAEIGFVPDEFARDNLISQHLAKLLEPS
jgi:aminoglycoside phosphotransferase (APT) family kinase protein